MSRQRIDVFVSSTIEDLKDHRAAVRDEILTFPECRPIMMEYFPAMDANAVKVCLDGVDASRIYIGIYAYRYGFCPKDSEISITEMEFNQATKNGIPRLCFLVDPKFDGWDEKLKDAEPNQTKLSDFKKRIDASMVRATFTTPDSLAKAVGRALRAALPAILTPDEKVPTPYPCQRIPKPAIFAGRVKELDDLKKALEGDQPVAITALKGVGGIGKTTLAQQVAYEMDEKFGLKLYATLGEKFDESRLSTILREWSQQDFAPDVSIDQMIAITKNVLTNAECGENVLALIDDVWAGESMRSARRLRDALPDGARILITTRSEKVAADLKARSQRLPHMPPNEGADLMLEHLKDTSAAEYREKLEELSGILGGHPLALTLAARLLRQHFTPRDLDDTIKTLREGMDKGDSFENLELDVDGSDEKEDSVSVTLKLTLDRLGGNDAEIRALRQQQFRALGALPPDFPFSGQYIAALWEGEDRKGLRELMSEGLLDDAPRPEKAPADSEWYTQHRLLRAYARGLAREANELDADFNRYADVVIEIAEKFDELPPEEWGALEADLPHVQVVGDTLVQMHKTVPDDTDLQTRVSNFTINITQYLANRREVHKVDWLKIGQDINRIRGNQKLESVFLNELGVYFNAIGERQKALEHFEQRLVIDRATGDQASEAVTLNNAGEVYRKLGNTKRGLKYYEQALSIYQALGDRGSEAGTLNNIGLLWSDVGETYLALEYYERALPLMRVAENLIGKGTILNNLGLIYDDLGEKEKALDFFQQALDLSRTLGDLSGEAGTLTNIGNLWLSLGETQKALSYHELALPIAQAVGDRDSEAAALTGIGFAWSALEDRLKALEYYDQALILMRTVGDRKGEATMLNNIGQTWNKLGEREKAIGFYEQALILRQAVEDPSGEAKTLNNIANIYSQIGELEKAVKVVEKIILIFQQTGEASFEAGSQINMAIYLWRLNRIDEAIDYTRQSIAILQKYHLPQDAAGQTLEQHKAFLQRLEAQKSGQSAPQPSREEIMMMLVNLYREQGADAVRTLLQQQSGGDAEQIEALLTQIAQAAGE